MSDDSGDSDAPGPAAPADVLLAGRRPARHPRRLVRRPHLESTLQRQGVLASHISAALRRLLGMRTLVGAASGSGMMAQVVGASKSLSRFLFCVTGPQAVDLATLWLSADGATLCSCWGHTENVALLSMAGQDSSCWHAEAFKAAVKDLPDRKTELSKLLRVAGGTQPYAVDISTMRGPAAAAFDGAIYSPVVATRRRLIKCIAVGCRSTLRRCHHATLVRQLHRLAATAGDDDASDGSSDEDDSAAERDVEEDERVLEEELVVISKNRQKRNLVACTEEDKQGMLWARTAEWEPVRVPPAAIFSPPREAAEVQPAMPAKMPTLVGRMAELGLAYDPSVVLVEKRCPTCGAEKPDATELVKSPALLYCDGNAVTPLEVRAHFFHLHAYCVPAY